MSSIQKVLISFEEYNRLKTIEHQFEELSKKYKSLEEPKSDQRGSGSNDLLTRQNLKEIIELVKQEITEKPRPVVTTWRNYDLTEPTITAIGHPQSAEPEKAIVSVEKSDLNDEFDDLKLLKRIPKEKKHSALELLKQIKMRPSEITFDSNGTIFIDDMGIEGSNIYKLFPLLFRRTVTKKFTGFEELISKLKAMGLEHLVQSGKDLQSSKNLDKALSSKMKIDDQWWYLD